MKYVLVLLAFLASSVYAFQPNELVEARELTNITQTHDMSRLFKKWVNQGLLIKIESEGKAPKYTKYKLSNVEDFKTQ